MGLSVSGRSAVPAASRRVLRAADEIAKQCTASARLPGRRSAALPPLDATAHSQGCGICLCYDRCPCPWRPPLRAAASATRGAPPGSSSPAARR